MPKNWNAIAKNMPTKAETKYLGPPESFVLHVQACIKPSTGQETGNHLAVIKTPIPNSVPEGFNRDVEVAIDVHRLSETYKSFTPPLGGRWFYAP